MVMYLYAKPEEMLLVDLKGVHTIYYGSGEDSMAETLARKNHDAH